jgi:hypothetical protein
MAREEAPAPERGGPRRVIVCGGGGSGRDLVVRRVHVILQTPDRSPERLELSGVWPLAREEAGRAREHLVPELGRPGSRRGGQLRRELGVERRPPWSRSWKRGPDQNVTEGTRWPLVLTIERRANRPAAPNQMTPCAIRPPMTALQTASTTRLAAG